ncbi:MAG TPA: hypothetical protein VIL88_06015 [Devosia sp.]|jgi:hypothetical protein|uniref:hypothetical protein n=1 Tax=Devosia sp. TaxID=1871048 RepID=UPI002F942847
MSHESLAERSVALRLEFSIADAVYQRGLLSVLAAAIGAWWNRPRLPPNLPANLRADLGLSPVAGTAHWLNIRNQSTIPDPLRRPSM